MSEFKVWIQMQKRKIPSPTITITHLSKYRWLDVDVRYSCNWNFRTVLWDLLDMDEMGGLNLVWDSNPLCIMAVTALLKKNFGTHSKSPQHRGMYCYQSLDISHTKYKRQNSCIFSLNLTEKVITFDAMTVIWSCHFTPPTTHCLCALVTRLQWWARHRTFLPMIKWQRIRKLPSYII